MKLVLTLEPYAKNIDFKKIINDLKLLGVDSTIDNKLSRRGEPILEIKNIEDIYEASKYIRNIEYICHIVELVHIIERSDNNNTVIEKLIDRCNIMISYIIRKTNLKNFKIICKRVDKKFPITSVELCKRVGNSLEKIGYSVDLHNPDFYIYIEIRKDVILLGWSPRDIYHKFREIVPLNVAKNTIAIVLEPLTIYEYMDLLQLARALGIELRIINVRGDAYKLVEEACRRLKIEYPNNVRVVEKAYALNDVDCLIVLSQYSTRGETYLRDISRSILLRGRKIGIMVGNEIEDVPLEFRESAICEIRLGPMTGQPMRSTVAIAYALGVIFNMFTVRERY